ncbi:hypothetical protein CTAYLR_003796 [Chrysophaeum taylorii]|uniref:Transmembrane protein 18 n=1 Tax=Chrysophaeum taylorii TaxID=2483200 RepID=A0AAD7UCZ1_9STRA|nr:hypothetical protein CTAYLR_003796 [Chrysophaeum taylorii]
MSNATSSFGEMLEGVQQSIFDLAKNGPVPETLRENIDAFLTAINWREPLLRGILAMHVLLWTTFVLSRKIFSLQCGLFLVIIALVAAAEPLNTLGRKRWREFASQDYFDRQGVFAASVYCTPLLVLLIIMMINFVHISANLLVDLKKMQLGGRRGGVQENQKEESPRPAQD